MTYVGHRFQNRLFLKDQVSTRKKESKYLSLRKGPNLKNVCSACLPYIAIASAVWYLDILSVFLRVESG